jgi:hypothetical protein
MRTRTNALIGGQISGYAQDVFQTELHGFLLAKGADGPVTQIDVPGAPRTIAGGLNDSGQLVGLYQNPNAEMSAQRGRAASMPLLETLGLGEREEKR